MTDSIVILLTFTKENDCYTDYFNIQSRNYVEVDFDSALVNSTFMQESWAFKLHFKQLFYI